MAQQQIWPSEYETVDRVETVHGWDSVSSLDFPKCSGRYEVPCQGSMVPHRADKLIFEVSPFLIISTHFSFWNDSALKRNIPLRTQPFNSLHYRYLRNCTNQCFFASWSSNNKYTLIGGIRQPNSTHNTEITSPHSSGSCYAYWNIQHH